MAPLICLLAITLIGEGIRFIFPSEYLTTFGDSVRIALASLFLLTGTAHFNKMKADLVKMVPAWLPMPGMWVFITGVIEVVAAIMLLVPSWSRFSAWGLIAFLIVIFPANVNAARERVMLRGRPSMSLLPRTLVQILFIAACLVVALR